MKKRFFAIAFACILLISLLCTGVSAQAEERVVLDNSIFYIDIPEGYEFVPGISNNYYIADDSFGTKTMEFFVGGNILFPQGFSRLDDIAIIDRVRRISDWSTDYSVDELKRGKINGQSAVVITGTDDFIYESGYSYYVFVTEEYYCAIEISYADEEERAELEEIISTFVLNGTHFDGGAPIKRHIFSNSPDYIEEILQYSLNYYETEASFDDGVAGVAVAILVFILLIPGVVIALIVAIVLCVKNKKLVKEFESYFGPIYAVRENIRAQRARQSGYVNYPPQQVGYPPQPNPYVPQGAPQQPYMGNFAPQYNPYAPQGNPQPTQTPPQPPVQETVQNPEAPTDNPVDENIN